MSMVKARDYKQERKTLLARGEDVGHAARNRARRLAVKKGMVATNDGKDVDHKMPLSKGGATGGSNLRVQTVHENRSFNRTKTGAVKLRKKK